MYKYFSRYLKLLKEQKKILTHLFQRFAHSVYFFQYEKGVMGAMDTTLNYDLYVLSIVIYIYLFNQLIY